MYIYILYNICHQRKHSQQTQDKSAITLPFLNSVEKHSTVCIKCQNKEKSVTLVEILVKSYVVFLVDLPNPHQVVNAWCVVHQL